MKIIKTILFLSILFQATGCNAKTNEKPKLIMNLGTTVQEFLKDKRTKDCKFIKDKYDIQKFYDCTGIEKTKTTFFSFYKDKLYLILVKFDEFDNSDTLLIKAALIYSPNDLETGEQNYLKKIQPALDAAETACKKTGPFLKETAGNTEFMPNGTKYQNDIRLYGDSNYRCSINLQKVKGPKGWFIIPEAITLVDAVPFQEAQSERQAIKEKTIEKEKTKFSF